MRPKRPKPKLRTVRCPLCRKAWLASTEESANVSWGVAHYDWPAKVCEECRRPAGDLRQDLDPITPS